MKNTLREPRILAIEDQADVRNLLRLALTRAGCDVAIAETGMEGLQLAETGKFDLITLDVDLPDMNGFEICSRLRNHAELRDTPVVPRCLEQTHRPEQSSPTGELVLSVARRPASGTCAKSSAILQGAIRARAEGEQIRPLW